MVRVTEEVYLIGRELEQNPVLLEAIKNVRKMDEIGQLCFRVFLEYLLRSEKHNPDRETGVFPSCC